MHGLRARPSVLGGQNGTMRMSNRDHASLSTCRTCLLGPDTNTTTLCVYAYFIAGISILATIIVSIFLVSRAASALSCMTCSAHAPSAGLTALH